MAQMSSLISEWKFSLVPQGRARPRPKDVPEIQMIHSNLAEFTVSQGIERR